MPLELPASSRFAINPDRLPDDFVTESHALILKISRSRTTLESFDRQELLEESKKHFSLAIGKPYYHSSSTNYAEFDLKERMKEAAVNAPLFLEALYDSVEAARAQGGYHCPEVEYLNALARTHSVPYVIEPPRLLKVTSGQVVPPPTLPASLAEAAAAILTDSMNRAENLLAAGNARGAVHETVWMLESLATAFRGVKLPSGEVRGSYFNQIARELKGAATGTTFERVIEWLVQLHGYLSSPAGGGIRHGIDLTRGSEISIVEARLFINLVLSYVTFMLAEHERLVTGVG